MSTSTPSGLVFSGSRWVVSPIPTGTTGALKEPNGSGCVRSGEKGAATGGLAGQLRHCQSEYAPPPQATMAA